MKKIATLSFLAFFFFAGAVFVRAQETPAPKEKKSGWRSFFSRDKERTSIKKKGGWFSGGAEKAPIQENLIDLIDTPTTRILGYGSYRANFRFYRDGGLLNHLSFGVFNRFNLGVSWDVEKFIGVEDPGTNVPTLYFKVRAYDGGPMLPSVALGYDGQGRFFNKSTDQYREREKGLFVVLGKELIHNFESRVGMSVSKFNNSEGSEGKISGFVGASYSMDEKFYLMMEYDNLRSAPGNRLNVGFRVLPISSFAVDFAVRNLMDSSERERIVRLNYVGSF